MMEISTSILLLISALLWLLVSRPQPVWRGEAAAQFAAAIILIPAAVVSIATASGLDNTDLLQADMVLMELTLYAALPLLSLVLISQAARQLGSPYDWERMIWGRILLGVCVLYEVCRRSSVLEQMLQVFGALIAIAMIVILVMHLRRNQRMPVEIIVSAAMVGLSIALISGLEMNDVLVATLFSGLIWFWHLQQSLVLRADNPNAETTDS